jgi:D-alanine-D-alanine ligase-like ATP-grasp enzyme
MSPEKKDREIPEHYSYVTRSLLRLHDEGMLSNVTSVDVEPKYGYTTRLTYTDGSYRITYGNDLGLNTGAACDLAKDKGHTKFMLRTIGVNCPEGEEFLMPWWVEKIQSSQRQSTNENLLTVDQIPDYIDCNIGYPAYIKPVDGSMGSNIFKLHNSSQISEVVDKYEEKQVRVAVVEESLNMPDYRVVCMDEELISAYRRIPLNVIGNGEVTIQELIREKQKTFELEGRDTKLDPESPDIKRYLLSQAMQLESVPSEDEVISLVPASNLSIGGTSEDVTDTINDRWSELAAYIAKNFSLRFCGIDLACEDITDPGTDYSIIEVNSSPGLDHYANTGEAQRQLVDRLYARAFNAFPTKSA